MGTFNCPNQYKMPGGRAFDELFSTTTMTKNVTFGWTLLFSNSCKNRIIRKINNYQVGLSLLNYIITRSVFLSLCYPIGHASRPTKHVTKETTNLNKTFQHIFSILFTLNHRSALLIENERLGQRAATKPCKTTSAVGGRPALQTPGHEGESALSRKQ